ncbi:MAG: aminotransferase class V-fold PLP-dependent enzyme [Clostridia bacterium]
MQGIYLDNAATSYPKAPGVSDAIADYICNVGANINRSTYSSATAAAMRTLEVREAACALFGFSHVEHVILTPGMTYSLNQVIKGLLRPGDHVIVGPLEHNAVMRPLMQLSDIGVTFSRMRSDANGCIDPASAEELITASTRMMLVSHASNVCGTLAPLERLSALCSKHSIPLVLDAAQTAGHYPIDFEALGLSALCAPGHKGLLGPQGIGLLLLNPDFAQRLVPLVAGGTGSASDSETLPAYMPDRFESGTPNLPGIYGLYAALDYIRSRTVSALSEHEAELTERLLSGLSSLPVRIVGTTDMHKRVGVVSVDFPTLDNAEAAFRLEREHSVLTRCGLHCSPAAHRALNTFPHGTLRFSLGYSNTARDVDIALSAISDILS